MNTKIPPYRSKNVIIRIKAIGESGK